MSRARYGLALLTALLGAAPAAAQHAAHVHGTAEMMIVIEEARIAVSLTAPAGDLVGFEHRPADDADRAAVAAVAATLADGVALMGPPAAAGCTLATVTIESTLLDGADGHDGARTGADHAHKDHDLPKEGDHSDFRVEYGFACTAPDALDALRMTYFKLFPRSRTLRVEGISDVGQFLEILTPDKPILLLPAE